MVASDISVFKLEVVQAFIAGISEQPLPTRLHLLHKVILSCLETQESSLVAQALLLIKQHCQDLQSLFREKLFMQLFLKLLSERKGLQLLGFCWNCLRESPHIGLL
jgi:hypothetical protein